MICNAHARHPCSRSVPQPPSAFLSQGARLDCRYFANRVAVSVDGSGDNAAWFMPTTIMRKLISLLCLLLMLLPCAAAALQVQDGDLLFVTAANTGLSAAIDDATRTDGSTSYDHVALVAHEHASAVVLHADEHGSRQQTLASFLAEMAQRHRHVDLYRLKQASSDVIGAAIVQARRMLGRPYNDSYVLDENSYYCSDFIERAFRAHKVFALQPLRFRNPDTGIIAPYWIEFYRQRGMQVPEGQPGTNPNDMARSSALVLRARLQ